MQNYSAIVLKNSAKHTTSQDMPALFVSDRRHRKSALAKKINTNRHLCLPPIPLTAFSQEQLLRTYMYNYVDSNQ